MVYKISSQKLQDENRKDLNESNTKKLTWAGVFKVCTDTYQVMNKGIFEYIIPEYHD